MTFNKTNPQKNLEIKLAAVKDLLDQMSSVGPKATKMTQLEFSQAEIRLRSKRDKLENALDVIAGAWIDFVTKAEGLANVGDVCDAYNAVKQVANDADVKAMLK